MGTAIADILPLAVGVAISVMAIIAVILMLFSKQARSTSVGFLIGWVLGVTVVATLTVLIANPAQQATGGEESLLYVIVHIVLGLFLQDGKGVSLQVKMPVGQKVSMARLIGTDAMLFSTGDAVDSPFVERGCRSKLTVRVANPERFLENWSCGLHRVVFYGDQTQDIRRFCRFAQVRVLHEGIDDLQNVDGWEWEPHVHA